jgi:hypothetical protein
MRRFGIRGEGRAGCIFWVLLGLITALVAAQVIPVKITSLQLKDHMKDIAMTQPRRPQDWFEKRIAERADELDIVIPKEQIRVKKSKERVVMDVKYSVPLEVLGFEWNWDIDIHLDRDLFLF